MMKATVVVGAKAAQWKKVAQLSHQGERESRSQGEAAIRSLETTPSVGD